VAVKVLSFQLSNLQQYGKKYTKLNKRKALDFLMEVEVINNLRHPNIVLYMGVCINSFQYLMITEYFARSNASDSWTRAACSTTCIRRRRASTKSA